MIRRVEVSEVTHLLSAGGICVPDQSEDKKKPTAFAKLSRTEKQKAHQMMNRLERIAMRLEALRVADYMETLERPWKLIWTNLIAGIARGLGFAIGTTVILAILIAILTRIVEANIPFITEWLKEFLMLLTPASKG